MKEKVLALLRREIPEIDFTASEELVDDGILDSLTITELIAALSLEFGITVPYEELNEEYLNSLVGIIAFVDRLKK